MGFINRFLWILKALWIDLSETMNILWNLQKLTFFGCPQEFYHRFMYITPSSGWSLLTHILHFWVMVGGCGCFLNSDIGKMMHFSKDWWKFIYIHPYYCGSTVAYRIVLSTYNQRVGGSSPPSVSALRQGILSTIVFLDPGVVNGYLVGIYSLKCFSASGCRG